jgi:hypothetical protein
MGAWETAQANVGLKYDPQEAALNRQIQNIGSQTAANEAGINQYGTGGRTGINDVYNTLNSLLTANRAQSASDLAQTSQNIGAGYDAGIAYTNAVANASRNRLSQLAQQVGGPTAAASELGVMSPFETTVNQILGAQNLAKSNAVGNTQNWAGKWDQILGQGINIGEQTRADRLARFETELMRMLGENKLAGLQGQNQLYGKLSDILGMRQNDLISSYNQLVQQEWENSFKQAQLNQSASAANAELAYKYAALGAENDRFNASQASKNDLSMSDIIDAVMANNKNIAAGQQQQFTNNLALANLGLANRKQDWTESTYKPPADPIDTWRNDIIKSQVNWQDDPESIQQQINDIDTSLGYKSPSIRAGSSLLDQLIPATYNTGGGGFFGLDQTPSQFSFGGNYSSGPGSVAGSIPTNSSGSGVYGNQAQYGGILGSILAGQGGIGTIRR